MKRRDKINYYLDIAEQVSKRCTCIRKHYGAVLVKDDEIISTGYVGAPRGRKNCIDINSCIREEKKIARGERYELCRSVHAEANAIISASRKDMLKSSMYLAGFDVITGNYVENTSSCAMCKRLIINAGIEKVYVRDDKENYRIINVNDWIENDESIFGALGY
ncbi:MAG: deaminase [Lachnospiraceae bacterium]|nr:deaminase [Lachnospiraceae bacterium]